MHTRSIYRWNRKAWRKSNKWYRRSDSNRHEQSPRNFESRVSTNSTTPAAEPKYIGFCASGKRCLVVSIKLVQGQPLHELQHSVATKKKYIELLKSLVMFYGAPIAGMYAGVEFALHRIPAYSSNAKIRLSFSAA